MVVLAGGAWERALGELLTSAEARILLGGISREALRKRVGSGSVIALRDDAGRIRYPRWQFDAASGAPFGAVKKLNEVFGDAGLDSWTFASFVTAPQSDSVPGLRSTPSPTRISSPCFSRPSARGRAEALSPRGLPLPEDLPELPSVKLGEEALWRIHAASRTLVLRRRARWQVQPRRFSHVYLAEKPNGAFVEKFGRLLRPGG